MEKSLFWENFKRWLFNITPFSLLWKIMSCLKPINSCFSTGVVNLTSNPNPPLKVLTINCPPLEVWSVDSTLSPFSKSGVSKLNLPITVTVALGIKDNLKLTSFSALLAKSSRTSMVPSVLIWMFEAPSIPSLNGNPREVG